MREEMRRLMFQYMMDIAEREGVMYGNVDVSFSLQYREGRATKLTCKDPVEHTLVEEALGMLL